MGMGFPAYIKWSEFPKSNLGQDCIAEDFLFDFGPTWWLAMDPNQKETVHNDVLGHKCFKSFQSLFANHLREIMTVMKYSLHGTGLKYDYTSEDNVVCPMSKC